MKAVIQRVSKASVSYRDAKEGIFKGIVVFVGVGREDTDEDAKRLAEKITGLRIFPNEQGKFDLSVLDTKGEILVVSQFTLFGDASGGKRPDFTQAARAEIAIPLYENFIKYLKTSGLTIKTGEFAADMLVEIHNNGPVTIILDTKDR